MKFRFLNENDFDIYILYINKGVKYFTLDDHYEEGNDLLEEFPSFVDKIKEKSFFMIGYFDDDLNGIVSWNHHQLCCLSINSNCDEKIVYRLLDKVKQLICGQLYVISSKENYDFYVDNDFKVVDSKDSQYNMVYQSNRNYDFQSYDEVHEFIMSLKQRVYALDHFKNFMNDFCDIQNRLKIIHIGGTNGKGSTTNYIREVLQLAGYKIGTFTSPALVSRLDVMRVNDHSILEDEILKYSNQYMEICLKYDLSMFEIEVFIAIMYFIDKEVDYAIFEVGLGGELDATNIVNPMVSVNTNIGLDHTDYLGDTYVQIARTKGGIIKENTAFITGEKKKECLDVFKEICDKHHSSLILTKEISCIQYNLDTVSFCYDDCEYCLMTGANYQCYNAVLAIEVLRYLKDNHKVNYSDNDLKKGLYQAKWKGRFEVIRKDPLIIIDGAHNKEGMDAFCNAAQKYSNIKIIFSALRDKDTHGMIEKLLELSDDLTICEFNHYRAQKAELLAENFPVKIEKDWQKAIDNAIDFKGVLFITGSLYFIALVRPYLLQKLGNVKF